MRDYLARDIAVENVWRKADKPEDIRAGKGLAYESVSDDNLAELDDTELKILNSHIFRHYDI